MVPGGDAGVGMFGGPDIYALKQGEYTGCVGLRVLLGSSTLLGSTVAAADGGGVSDGTHTLHQC
jgi:hypothetical protein